MKAILLAGGTGTRIWPISSAVNKQLLPVYDKPMIYYPLTTLMFAGATEILLITNENAIESFKKLLGNGSQWGISITYAVQEKPGGIPEAFLLAPNRFKSEPVALMLGDNLLYGMGLGESLKQNSISAGAKIFAYQVSNPHDYGVVVLSSTGMPLSMIEKPQNSESQFAIPGLYFFDSTVYERAKTLKPSKRGELEIVDLLNLYLKDGSLIVEILERGIAWLDTGSASSLLAASEFVRVIEDRQGMKIGCPEEISLRLNLINREQFNLILDKIPEGQYKKYLQTI